MRQAPFCMATCNGAVMVDNGIIQQLNNDGLAKATDTIKPKQFIYRIVILTESNGMHYQLVSDELKTIIFLPGVSDEQHAQAFKNSNTIRRGLKVCFNYLHGSCMFLACIFMGSCDSTL